MNQSPDNTLDSGKRLRLAVLGCSGSIGTQTLDVCKKHADKLEVSVLSVHRNTKRLVAAAREFGVRAVVVSDPSYANDPVLRELPEGCELLVGRAALREVCRRDDVDCVVNALVGAAGIGAGHEALSAGKRLAYANKESIVAAGDLLMPLAKPGQLIPVDSEHSAIFQCLVGEEDNPARRIWLTCSGGPFYGKTAEELADVTAADALAHPTWKMGDKITIDCATLMNKGLEVIEAHHLFGVDIDDITVLVHQQSRIHSMVEFADGSVKAQLGPSDMRITIQYAFSHPDRWDAPCDVPDWRFEPSLVFGEADESTFACLALAREAGAIGGTMPCVLNAANEVANQSFRNGVIGFLQVADVVGQTIQAHEVQTVESLDQLLELDAWARAFADEYVRGIYA